MRPHKFIVAIALLVFAQFAFAQAQTIDAETVLGLIKDASGPALDTLTSKAISWLGIFAALQFFITNYNLLKSDGDIQSAIAKMVTAVGWVGICLYLINHGPQFIKDVGNEFFTLLGVNLPTPGSIIARTIVVGVSMALLAIGASAAPLIGNTVGMLLVYVTIIVFVIGLFFAFKIFMLQLELGLIAILAPLSFAFLGLNTLRDQGIVPFKALISLAYRIILLTVILSAFDRVSDVVSNVLSSTTKDSFLMSPGTVANVMLSAVGAYILLAYLIFKSDSIAASLASGSTSMGTGDVAQAAAAGAAMGAAVGAGGAALAGTGGQAPKAMSAFMDKLMGRSSISNASSMGGGGDVPSFTAPPVAPATASPALSIGAPVSEGAPVSSSPSRPQSGTASSPAKANVASGRYGADLAGEGRVQSDAGNAPSAEKGVATGEAAGAHAGATDPVTATPAGSKGDAAAVATDVPDAGNGHRDVLNAPSAGQSGAIEEATSAGAAATDGVTVTPAGSQGKAADATRAVPGARMPANSKGKGGEAANVVPEAGPQTADPGSASSAGISGKPSLEQDLTRLVDHLTQQGPRKPTLGERLGEANKHLAQEQATTHVSINAHHTD